MLENLIAYHCGPALAGIKPANMVSCNKSRIPDLHKQIGKLSGELKKRDIHIEVLCECKKNVLLMVYRRNVLEKYLKKTEITEFLSAYGYPENASLKDCISFLKRRLKKEGFPHEIGAFLGYPLHDIYGFINNPGDYLISGDWKVYDDAEGAKKLFSRYKACRKAIVRRLEGGCTLAQIFCAA